MNTELPKPTPPNTCWYVVITDEAGLFLNDFRVEGPRDYQHYVAPFIWELLRKKQLFNVRYEER